MFWEKKENETSESSNDSADEDKPSTETVILDSYSPSDETKKDK